MALGGSEEGEVAAADASPLSAPPVETEEQEALEEEEEEREGRCPAPGGQVAFSGAMENSWRPVL